MAIISCAALMGRLNRKAAVTGARREVVIDVLHDIPDGWCKLGGGWVDIPSQMLAVVVDELAEHRHQVEFTEYGWMVQHPMHERLAGTLFGCKVGFGHLAEAPAIGRYWVEDDGSLTAVGS